MIDTVPALPRVRVPDARFDFFTRPESEALLAAGRSPDERATLLFALHTGARARQCLQPKS